VQRQPPLTAPRWAGWGRYRQAECNVQRHREGLSRQLLQDLQRDADTDATVHPYNIPYDFAANLADKGEGNAAASHTHNLHGAHSPYDCYKVTLEVIPVMSHPPRGKSSPPPPFPSGQFQHPPPPPQLTCCCSMRRRSLLHAVAPTTPPHDTTEG